METARPVQPSPKIAVQPERTADVLVGILADAGVEVVFGLPGGTISPLFDALLDRPQVRVIHCRNESGAMFAAAGYAHVTRRIGVVMVTSGPGITNAMTGLATAYCDGLPLLLLAGEVPRRVYGRGALQEGSPHHLNIVEMTSHVCKMAIEIPDPNSAPSMLRKAISTALSGRPGPVLVTLPLDVTTAITTPTAVSLDVATTYTIQPWAVEEAAHLLIRSRRTVIFAGSGMRNGDGAKKLLEFAEHTQTPVMTTPKGKGVFPEDHPLSLGVFGLGGHPSASVQLESGVDVLLAVGTSLSDVATNGWSRLLQPRQALIHVDVDARQIGRTYASTLGVAAPAELFLDKLKHQLPSVAQKKTLGVRQYTDPSTMTDGRFGRVAPQRVLWELQKVMPPDAIFTVDSGEHFLFAVHYLRATRPDGFIALSGLGSMGSGMGAALGARLARPDRPVIAVCGDGGFAMACTEIATATAESLPVLYVVMNDERLGMVELGHNALYGRTPSYGTGGINVVKMAQALGAQAMAVEEPGVILECAPFLREMRGPVVLDVRIDPQVRMPKHGRFEALGSADKRTPVAVK